MPDTNRILPTFLAVGEISLSRRHQPSNKNSEKEQRPKKCFGVFAWLHGSFVHYRTTRDEIEKSRSRPMPQQKAESKIDTHLKAYD
jgi:hypothetical protein